MHLRAQDEHDASTVNFGRERRRICIEVVAGSGPDGYTVSSKLLMGPTSMISLFVFISLCCSVVLKNILVVNILVF